jgi:DNA-binding response OmpR family regulator
VIVIADNDDSTRTVLHYALSADGYEVETVSDGQLLWPMLERGPVTLLILDLRMPGMNGWEVLRRLRHPSGEESDGTPLGVPVIVISGQSDPETGEFATRLGATAFLPKPLDLGALRATVRRALRGVSR